MSVRKAHLQAFDPSGPIGEACKSLKENVS
jgi:hypothetical protein